ncbi:dTDP-4-dehydrorhamnose reductase [Sandaracinobacter sp. RS1-74]|uniref:dTDP-4-dehydrorhamnose reductase n=1 Tax=Sandaracinobacteroides sayramensis TaxID=2913411 RepID=UPI001EDB543F|nr:dTDP-4-dehydrorhamnose reductase [Sandaracinobacteroides sayramensis]MCG2840245.1 dTDP-4-dehydrorhamnose reductase [Sandaracinobacteroides sayramensis]
MKILIAGAAGQLGRALQATAPAGAEIVAPPEAEFDILNPAQVAAVVSAARPDLLVNAAAYTAVDKAEGDYDTALAVNATAAAGLAKAAADAGARFAHVSTDFVFDGLSPTPYPPDATPAPIGAYGETKLKGEEQVRAAHPDALIVRTAWVYAAEGNNFVRTMLRLMRERPEIRVVADQIGSPTHAASLARAIWALDAAGASGLYHWTDAGVASWYDFAVAIRDEALAIGLLSAHVPVVPIRTSDYPTPAKRPHMSVLDKTSSWAVTGPAAHWREELRLALKEMKELT